MRNFFIIYQETDKEPSIIAEGMAFTDGKCVIVRWSKRRESLSLYNSVTDLEIAIQADFHTRIVWRDYERMIRLAGSLVNNWNEFGPEADFDEVIHQFGENLKEFNDFSESDPDHVIVSIPAFYQYKYFNEAEVNRTLEATAPYFSTKQNAQISLRVILDKFINEKLRLGLSPLPYPMAKFIQELHNIFDPIQDEQERANAIARMGGADGARAIVALLDLKKVP